MYLRKSKLNNKFQYKNSRINSEATNFSFKWNLFWRQNQLYFRRKSQNHSKINSKIVFGSFKNQTKHACYKTINKMPKKRLL